MSEVGPKPPTVRGVPVGATWSDTSVDPPILKVLGIDGLWTVVDTLSSGGAGSQGPPGLDGPEGEVGEQGPPGAAGPAGAGGSPGSAGAPGTAGPPGLDGQDGEDGPMGPPGLAGSQGPAGDAGSPGAAGIMGPPGVSGDDGDTGEPGPPGLPGAAGPTGVPGDAGTQGLAGIGVPGNDGDDGYDGPPGPQGLAGSTGAPGNDGAAGSTGPQGRGAPGLDGDDGYDGWPGPQGPAGAAGAPGGLTLITGATGTVASGAAPTETVQVLTANNADIPTTTVVTQLTAQTLAAGWWLVEYWVLWQSNVTTTGITFIVNHSGTAVNFQATRIDPLASSTALATVGIFDQQPTTAVTGKLPSVWATRTNGGALGPNDGVVATNVNEMTYITALFLVTVSGNLLLQANSEIASTITRVVAGTMARYTRLS